MESLEERCVPATFNVTNTLDSGIGSLRQAIIDANGTVGANTIQFAIPSGPTTISLSTVLPTITNTVLIDGTTQPGYAGNPVVVIDGSKIGGITDGLSLVTGSLGSAVKGVAVTHFFYGIHIQSNNNSVTNDFLVQNGAGVYIDGGTKSASGNTIGGGAAGATNVLSLNVYDGAVIGGVGATNNTISGNLIGTGTAGTTVLANGVDGVFVFNGASSNTIGGLTAGARNIISGNSQNGVEINGTNTGTGNTVDGNFIGLDVSGTVALANNNDGVLLNGSNNNTIGGNAPQADPAAQVFGGNVISGNGMNGVEIRQAPADSNIVEGNYIGTDVTGTKAVGNGYAGVNINSTAILNTIGGFLGGGAVPRNVISGNGVIGVQIADVGTMSNNVESNYIGTNAAGTAALGNTFDGVLLTNGASNNKIGGGTSQGNVISGNGRNGVYLYFPTTKLNLVEGNFIGLNSNGSVAIANKGDGVQLANGANQNTIGGPVSLALPVANIISGNSLYGVEINDSGTFGNQIQGNYIGTSAGGTVKVANQVGVYIHNKATSNTIGGTIAGAGNSIAGNIYGVVLGDSGTTGNQLQSNFIGTNGILNSANIGNTLDGVYVYNQAAGNVIGGVTSGVRNVISGNGRNGITITDPGTINTVVANNYIGTTNSGAGVFGNASNGIAILNGVTSTTIGGSSTTANVISGNGITGSVVGAGIDISDPTTTGIKILGNFIGTSAPGNDVQSLLIIGNPTGGSFTLTLNGLTTGPILYNATAVQVAAAVQLLFSNGETVVGTGGPLPNGSVVLTFGGTLTNLPVNTLTANGAGLTGGSSPTVVINHTRIGGNASSAVRNGIGILIEKGSNTNQIGGTSPGQGNIISGNVNTGVQIQGAGTNANLLLGNNIGVDNTSVNPIPNGTDGVLIQGGAQSNTIGGTGRGAFNVIAGNAQTGVHIAGVGTINNLVEGDYIGNSAPVNDVQTIQINGIPTAGNFQLAFGSQLTVTIPYNATAAQVQAALQGIPSIGANNVAVTGGPFPGVPMVITFQGSLQSSPVPVLAVVNNTLNNGATVSILHTTFGSTNIGAGNQLYGVELSGGVTSITIGGDITTGSRNFISGNAVSGVYIADAGTANNLVAGNLIGTNAALNDVQTIAVFGNPSGGSYTLTGAGGTSGPISLTATASAIQTAVAAIIIPGGTPVTDVLVEGGPLPGTPITLTFQGNLANQNLTLLVANSAGLTGGTNPTVVVSHTVTGQFATAQIANQDGIEILNGANNNLIGGVTDRATNVISGNNRFGVLIGGAGTSFNAMERNLVGVLQDTVSPLGNGSHGVFITDNASSNTIGGVSPDGLGGPNGVTDRNIIAFSGTNKTDGNGVLIGSDPGIGFDSAAGTGNAVVGGNLIYGNFGLPIDLGPNDGGTPNDFYGHIGPNSFQNKVVLAPIGTGVNTNMDSWKGPGSLDNPAFNAATKIYTGIQIVGKIHTTANSQIRLEFNGYTTASKFTAHYLNREAVGGDPATVIGPFSIPPVGQYVLVLTTDANGNASFVYNCDPSVQRGDALSVATTNLGTNDSSEYTFFNIP